MAVTDDPRFAEQRCQASFTTDRFDRFDHRCHFRFGHDGMHFCAQVAWVEGREEYPDDVGTWWGDQAQAAWEWDNVRRETP